jgi:hypothetical protein
MGMMDMRFKPSWLPQVSAPYTYVVDKMQSQDIPCKLIKVDPKKLKPSQGLVLSDKISSINPDDIKPIFISKDDFVIDGHHRYGSALSFNEPHIKAVRIMLPQRDAARMLNKISDIFEYEQQQSIEEVVAQDAINLRNDPDTDPANFLEMLEADLEDGKEMLLDTKKNKKKIKGYRTEPLKENSRVGNFFILKPLPVDGYKEYEMEFDNLLDTDDLNMIYRTDQTPVGGLAKTWFPNIDFSQLAGKYKVKPESLINRAICDKAKRMGYDGIKYGDIMIQGF